MNHYPKRGSNLRVLTSAYWVPLTLMFACGGNNSSESSALGGSLGVAGADATGGNDSVAGRSATGGSRAAGDSLAAGG